MRSAFAFALALALGCDEPPPDEPTEGSVASTEANEAESTANTAPPEAGPIPPSWVTRRAAEARGRMTGSEAGALVWRAIEAHGGLEKWLGAGTLRFTFDYQPVGAPERRMHTRQKVDLWRARAVHEELDGDASGRARFGWDGEQSWIVPDAEAFPSPPRFWSLTPYYFVGMPFVGADPGTRYERLPDGDLDGQTHQRVKITYEPGTGDSPDDYYVLYLHPETHGLAALRYVVAYPGFFPEGGHTPEKIMRYTDLREVDGLQLAQTLDTYTWDGETELPGEKVTDIDVTDLALGETYPGDAFAPPEGAVVSATIEANPR